MTKAEIKAIRLLLGFNTDLRVKLYARQIGTLENWLEKNLTDVFGSRILEDLGIESAKYCGGAWLRPDGEDAYIAMHWGEQQVIARFCEIQAWKIARGECTEEPANQLSYKKFGYRLNPDWGSEKAKERKAKECHRIQLSGDIHRLNVDIKERGE